MSDSTKGITIQLPEQGTVKADQPPNLKAPKKPKDKYASLKREIDGCNWDAFEEVIHTQLRDSNYKLVLSAEAPTFNYDGLTAKTLLVDDIFARIDGTEATVNEFLSKGLPPGRSYTFTLKQGSAYVCKTPPLRIHIDGAGGAGEAKTTASTSQPKGLLSQLTDKIDLGTAGTTLLGLSELIKAIKQPGEGSSTPAPAKDDSLELFKTLLLQQQQTQQAQQQAQANSSNELAEVIKAFTEQQNQQQNNSMTEMVKLFTVMSSQQQNTGTNDNDLVKSFLEMNWDQRKLDRQETKDMIENLGQVMNDPIEQMERLEELKARLTPGRSATPPIPAGGNPAAPASKEPSSLDKLADIAVGVWDGLQRKQAHDQQVMMQQAQMHQQAAYQEAAYQEAGRIGEMMDRPVADPTAFDQQVTPSAGVEAEPETQPEEMTGNDMLSLYEGALQKMIDEKKDAFALLVAIKEYVLFAKENGLQIREIEETQGDLAESFNLFVSRRSADEEYVQKVLSMAQDFRPLLNDFSFDDDPTRSQPGEVQDEKVSDAERIDLDSPVSDDATEQAQVNQSG